VKDCFKLSWVSKVSTKSKEILQGGFKAKVSALSNILNLLKVKCKVNNKGICCLLDSRATNLFMIL
jgi:hypothetical protein